MVCGLLSHAWHPQTGRMDVTLAAARLVWLFLLFLRANIGVSQAFLLVKTGYFSRRWRAFGHRAALSGTEPS